MGKFILVHGAWHGAWCWEKVVPLLEEAGHEVVTFDLPGHGDDATSIPNVSLQAYTDRIVAELDASDEPVVLVGHSMGGIPLSQAAEARPEKISKLVYLTAFLLKDGQTLLEVARADVDALVLPNAESSEDQSAAMVKDEALRETFYADCTDEDFERAKERLVWQAVAPFATPVSVSEISAGVSKVYIECAGDRAISIACQRAMQQGVGVDEVITMETSHSPFLSAPEELAGNLGRVAAE